MNYATAVCLGQVAPFYNIALVIIVISLFVVLFRLPKKKGTYLDPWKFLFIALLVYVIEELLTITNKLEITNIPRISTAFFEMIIITLFIYALLLQREWLKKGKK